MKPEVTDINNKDTYLYKHIEENKEELLCKLLERIFDESPEETYLRVIGCTASN